MGRIRQMSISILITVCTGALIPCCVNNETGGDPGSDAKAITAFGFTVNDNPFLQEDISGLIIENSITVYFPINTNLLALKASFTFNGSSVTVNGTEQMSGSTLNDFSSTVPYRVTAEDGSSADYTVNIKMWRTPVLLATSDEGKVYNPLIASDSNGNTIALWLQNDGSYNHIVSSRYTKESGWSTAEYIESSTGTLDLPVIACDPSGNALAVWIQNNVSVFSIWASRYTTGIGWGDPQLLETDDTGDALSPDITINSNGNAIAVWYQWKDSVCNIWANRYTPGTGWGNAEIVMDDDSGDHQFPKAVIDQSGNTIVVWEQTYATGRHIYSRKRKSGNEWGDAVCIEIDSTGYASSVEIAMDSSGNAIAVWDTINDGHIRICACLYTPSNGWSSAEYISGDTGTGAIPKIAMNSNGDAVVVWISSNGTCNNVSANYFSIENGWGTAECIQHDTIYDIEKPDVTCDSAGTFLAIWSQTDGNVYNIRENRFSMESSWRGDALIETYNTSHAENPSIICNSPGNALAVWSHDDGSRSSIIWNIFY